MINPGKWLMEVSGPHSTRHEIKCCETHNVKIVDGIVVQRTDETSEDDLEMQKVRRNLFPLEQLSSGKGAKPKIHSRHDSGKKNIQTPEQLFPMEQTIHSRSKPDVKPKVPSGKPNNKNSPVTGWGGLS